MEKGGVYTNGKLYPIPPGSSPYSLAKRAEYIEKDLPKAEYLYRLAIDRSERLKSSIKDLASILHQQNRTSEAVALLRKNRHLYKRDGKKFDNLLLNFEKQLEPTGSSLNRCIKVEKIRQGLSEDDVAAMFGNSQRILKVEMSPRIDSWLVQQTATVTFSSHSAARKALENFTEWDNHQLKWMTIDGDEIAGIKSKSKSFHYWLFHKDPAGGFFTIPIDGEYDESITDTIQEVPDNYLVSTSLEANSYEQHVLGQNFLKQLLLTKE